MATVFDGVTLRTAKAGEFDPAAVAAVINDAYMKYEFWSGMRTSTEELPGEIGTGEMIFAEREGRIVGTAMVRPSLEGERMEGEGPDHRHAGALYFGLAAVARTEQHSGIGKMLVARVEAIALERGFREVLLGTLAEMGNVQYYEALGYRTISRERFAAPHWGLSIDHWHHAMVKELVPNFRVARVEEARALAALINSAYVVEAFFKVSPERAAEAEVAQLIGKGTFLVTDGPGGGLRGVVYVTTIDRRGCFGMLSVAPSSQRSGLGRQLIAAAEAFAVERGCSAMDLKVVNLREELGPFYEKAGYRVSGTEPWPNNELGALKLPAHFVTMTKDITPFWATTEPRK